MAKENNYTEIMSNGLTVVEFEDPERIKKEKRRKRLNTAAKIGIGALALIGAGAVAVTVYNALTYIPEEDSEDNEDDVIDVEVEE